MQLNLNRVLELVRERDWSGAELGRQMGISRAEANRLLNGKRSGGNKIIEGLLLAFPNETFSSLFILSKASPNVNINCASVPKSHNKGGEALCK